MHRGSGCDPLGDRVGEGEELLRAGRSCVRVPAWPGVTGRGFRVHREDDGMVGRVDTEADDVAGHPEGPDPVRPEAVLLQDAVQTIPGLPAGAGHAAGAATSPGPSGVGFFPGGRVASRRSPSTPRARKRSRRRRTVGFDMPVRRMVPAGPQPEPGSGTMRARQTCFRRLRGLRAIPSRRARSSSESLISCRVDFRPMLLSCAA